MVESSKEPKHRKKIGRPKIVKRNHVFTLAVRKQLITLLEQGNTLSYSCEALNVSPSTVYNYRLKHDKYDRQVRKAMTTQITMVADAIYTNAVAGNTTAQIFYLVNRTRHMPRESHDKWMNLSSIEMSGPDGNPIQTTELTHEERQSLLLEYAKRAERAESLPKASRFKKPMESQLGLQPD